MPVFGSMLGFLILMGTVVNNPILIVDQAMRLMEKGGSSPREAVREAVALRFRPIAMSTLTTICGLSPLVFMSGAGTELYRGVGAIVLFGILGAAIVSLTMLPALTVTVPDIVVDDEKLDILVPLAKKYNDKLAAVDARRRRCPPRRTRSSPCPG